MNDQRRPAPRRRASSISATVATSSATSHSASRHSASISRSAMKPSISVRTRSGRIPTDAIHRLGPGGRLGGGQLARADLDQREQVDRVEGVADGHELGVRHVELEPGRPQPRGRRAEDDAVPRGPARPRQERALELLALRRVLLHEVHSLDGILRGGHELERALRRPRRQGEPGGRAAGILEHGRHLLFRRRVGIEQPHVDPREHEPGRPAAADDAAAQQPDRSRPAAARFSHRG